MFDIAALIASIGLLVAYQIFLQLRIRKDPLYTVHGVNMATREVWVDAVMSSGKSDVLAVQTLRNSVMASSFMASTAILLLIGSLSMTGATDHPNSLWHALNVSGATSDQIIALKLIFLVVDFFVAFFCFSMAVRFFNHVGYMITVPPERTTSAVSAAVATAYLNRAGLFYLLGIRSFFYAVPLVFWMFGPHFMIGATLVLIAALYPLDRAPRAQIAQSSLRQAIATPVSMPEAAAAAAAASRPKITRP